VTTSAQSASSNAVSTPKTMSSDQLDAMRWTPRVRSAVSHMNAPVSTGYSTVVSR